MSGAPVSDPIPDRPPAELPPSTIAPGAPPHGGRAGGLAEEVKALAELLTNVVVLATDRAVFPPRLEAVAQLALEHDSVRRALLAEGCPPSVEHIVDHGS